jgi:polyhydroxybutyrate depolymerase
MDAMGQGGTDAAGGMTSTSGDPNSIPSTGCGLPAADTPETFVQHNTQAGGFARSYYVRLPAGYDPMRAYPLLVIGPGCGGTGDNAIPIQDQAGTDAIVVGLNISAEAAGRDCFMTESPTSPELAYFDVMWSEVESAYCIDTAKVLYGGFSSGSWLANLLGCARSNIIRAQGNVAGGPPPLPECAGPVAALMIHDENDGSNGIGGGQTARDRILSANGCAGTDTAAWDPEFPACQAYTGCPAEYPVVWCQTTGAGHDPQNSLSGPAFWKFLTSLPPEPTP